MSGFYLALEGIEGSGKSTLGRLLGTRLSDRRIDSISVREPGGTELGEELRRLVLHAGHVAPWAEAALFAASRAQLAVEVIAPALADGRWVISDRSYYSSLAYQGGGRGLGVDSVRRLNETVLDGVLPDLVVVLDIEPEVGFARETERDRIGEGGLALQRTVAETYRRLAAEDDRIMLLDASVPPEELADAALSVAMERRRHV
ncbi:MAG: dTMP kinase [Acidimicrobiia bacterium]|nr:dTMP kinase [Acidimicrobiia bacterium]